MYSYAACKNRANVYLFPYSQVPSRTVYDHMKGRQEGRNTLSEGQGKPGEHYCRIAMVGYVIPTKGIQDHRKSRPLTFLSHTRCLTIPRTLIIKSTVSYPLATLSITLTQSDL